MTRRRIIFILVATSLLGLLLLAQCETQRIKVVPQPTPGAIYTLYLPVVMKNYPRRPLHGVAASGNGGMDAVIKTGASWYINWSYQPGIATSAEFVPMINAPLYPVPDTIADSEYLMGANEPNIREQVNVCPADYVSTWREIETRWGDRKLVSPGVGFAGNITCISPDGAWHYYIDGATWLTDFRVFYYRQYGTYPQWDALSFHCYMPPEAPCPGYKPATETMIALADAWGVPEVWLSEFDGGKWGAENPQNLRDALVYFATVPKLTRIAYYQDWSYAAPQNSPLTDTAGNLTEYGRAYR